LAKIKVSGTKRKVKSTSLTIDLGSKASHEKLNNVTIGKVWEFRETVL